MMWTFLQGAALAHFSARRYEEAVAWVKRSIQDHRRSPVNWRVLASSYAHLNRINEAQSSAEELLRLDPGFSLSRRGFALSAANPDFVERYIDGLRKAGLKE
jgi:predicted Zn-dependent protease